MNHTTSSKRSGGAQFDAHHLHIQAFAAEQAQLAGEAPLSQFPRLQQESVKPQDAATVQWQAQGRTVPVAGGAAEIWLDLEASTTLWMTCQRCLEPVQQTIAFARSFRFVRDEASAILLDDEIEEDVLVYGKDFQLFELIEDELLMAVPVGAYHDTCPQSVAMHTETDDFAAAQTSKPNPFAVLQSLKKTQ